MPSVIPYGRQRIDDKDIAAVEAVLRGDFLTTGPAVGVFETDFASKVDAVEAVAVSNGTAALHLAMAALDIGPQDQVVVPSLTFLASANCAAYLGAEVIFADVDADTGLLTPRHLEAALSRAPRAKAAVVVHLNGVAAKMPELKQVADAHGIVLVEDACHALGTVYGDQKHKIGSCQHSIMASFSFHPVKTIATGEGGALTTRDPALAERLRQLRSHGMRRGENRVRFPDAYGDDGRLLPWMYEMAEFGWNYRMPDILAALGSSQLKKLDGFLARRRSLVANYNRALKPLTGTITPVATKFEHALEDIGWHLYPILCSGGAEERLALFDALLAADIRPQIHYFPVHRQPFYAQKAGDLRLPGADRYYERVISLPLYVDLDDNDQQRVIDTVIAFYN